jgi:hypothetical protein
MVTQAVTFGMGADLLIVAAPISQWLALQLRARYERSRPVRDSAADRVLAFAS